jgi:hypothetical protein
LDPPDGDSDEGQHDQVMNDYGHILELILASQVLNASDPVAKCSQLYLVLIGFKANDWKQFCLNLRVSPSTFDELVGYIQNHPIFQNRSNCSQYPVEIQLAIALFRFRHNRNAASVEAIAQWAGVSVGLVVKATQQVIIAFLALHDSIICWPSLAEKKEAKQWVEDNSCTAWRDGFCMVDGTLVPLAEKPGHHGEAYFDRKSNHSLNVQVSPFVFISEFMPFDQLAYYPPKLTHHRLCCGALWKCT